MAEGRTRYGVVFAVAAGLSALALIVILLLPRALGQREVEVIGREAAVRASSLAAALSEPLKAEDPSAAAAILEDIRAARGTDYAYLVVWDKEREPIVGVNRAEAVPIDSGIRFGDGLVHVAVPVPETTATLQIAIPDARHRHYRHNLVVAGFIALALLLGGAVVAAGGARLPRALLRDAAAINNQPRSVPAPEPLGEAGHGLNSDAYLAWMSHELRTPLNAIIGYSEMLEEDAVFLEQNDFIPDLKNIRKAGRHMLSLVDDVVDLSRLHAGDIDLDVSEVEVAEFVDEVARDVRSLVDRTLGTLDVSVAPTAGTIEVDRSKLQRALGNLLRQVIGLTGQGEMILLVERVGVDGVDMVQFALTHPGLELDRDTIQALLSDYTRPDQRALPQYARTGLGLVVTREFAELMGGDLLVQAAEQGSTFLLRVPARVKAR